MTAPRRPARVEYDAGVNESKKPPQTPKRTTQSRKPLRTHVRAGAYERENNSQE